MPKPNNSIANIKLPGENTQRPIIPYSISDGTHVATVPQMTQDSELALRIDIIDLTQS